MLQNCYNCRNVTKGARYCSKKCWIEDALPTMIEKSGMNKGIYKNYTFENAKFISKEEKILEGKVKKYLSKEIEKGLFIFGSTGNGKTYIIFAVVREVMKALMLEAKVFSVPRMIADYKDNHFDNRIIRKAEGIDIAIFDDLGSEYQDKNNLSTELLTRIIDERLVENRLTFFTSNLTPKMIGETLDSRLISRIKAMTFSIEMKGKDRRNE